LVRIFIWLLPIAVLTVVPLMPARADFFDDARKTFKIDIPRFFQHDIPCAFGGKPTSHTNTSCKSSEHLATRKSSPRHSPQAAKLAHRQGPRVVRSFRDASGQPCRVVNETVLIDGEKTLATGTVCKQSDGHWSIAAADADIATQPSRLGALDVVSAKRQPMP
jgi:hypothetical protein